MGSKPLETESMGMEEGKGGREKTQMEKEPLNTRAKGQGGRWEHGGTLVRETYPDKVEEGNLG